MKQLKDYILEQQNETNVNHWLTCVKQMYDWYCKNFNGFYDKHHLAKSDNWKQCPLIDNKEVIADCSGFIAACMCLAGYIDTATKFNVRLGSFNKYKTPNVSNLSQKGLQRMTQIIHIVDVPQFKSNIIKDRQTYTDVKAGDILVKGRHVTIAADDGAKHIYDWGSEVKDKHKAGQSLDFYLPKDKTTITYPYRSYWRVK